MIRQGILRRLGKLEAAQIPKQREVDPYMVKFLEQDPEAGPLLRKLWELKQNDPYHDSNHDSSETEKLLRDFYMRYAEWREEQEHERDTGMDRYPSGFTRTE